jgi:hypothetical protein
LAGLVRGFTGFSSALIYMPLISAVYSPRPWLLLIDSICSLPFALHVMPQCNWREIAPGSVAGAVLLPLGAMALVLIDPLSLRWFIAGLVLVALVTLAGGWRYHATLAASLCVGAVQIGAPPLLVFWLGSNNNAGARQHHGRAPPPHRLFDHRVGGTGEPAGVRFAAMK